MAEGRMLKKKVSLSEAVADLSSHASRVCFTWAIAHLDIDGYITGSTRSFRALVVPLLTDISPEDIASFFREWHEKGLAILLNSSRGPCLRFPGFRDNQGKLNPEREAKSIYSSCIVDNSVSPPGALPEKEPIPPGALQEPSQITPSKVKLSKDKERSLSRDLFEDFNKFWAVYPKKRAKQEALKKWQGLKKAGDLPPLEKIIAAVEEQKTWSSWQEEDGRFIPYPATWLNNGQWDDQPMEKAMSPTAANADKCPDCGAKWRVKNREKTIYVCGYETLDGQMIKPCGKKGDSP